MRPTLCLIAFLLGCSTASTHPDEKPAQLAELNLYGDFLSAEGIFRADILSDKTELAFDTVTRIECYKHGEAMFGSFSAARCFFVQTYMGSTFVVVPETLGLHGV